MAKCKLYNDISKPDKDGWVTIGVGRRGDVIARDGSFGRESNYPAKDINWALRNAGLMIWGDRWQGALAAICDIQIDSIRKWHKNDVIPPIPILCLVGRIRTFMDPEGVGRRLFELTAGAWTECDGIEDDVRECLTMALK